MHKFIMITEMAEKILSNGFVCDYCIGRQFSKLSENMSNEETGKIVRDFMSILHNAKKTKIDSANFLAHEKKKCVICDNLFSELPAISDKISNSLKKIEFSSFLVGVKMSDSLVVNEENLWEKTGIKYCEPIKVSIGREISHIVLQNKKRTIEHKKPDVLIIFDMNTKSIEVFPNSIFVYGEYKKYSRGIAQTSSHKYKKTVQDIIAKPIISATKADDNVFHALGREDRNARCLAWRPFIIEIKHPLKRKPDLNKIKKKINMGSHVKVNKLKFTEKSEISSLKSRMPFKVYRIIVDFEKPVESPENIKKLVGRVKQKTPSRLLNKKMEKIKNKKVKSIKWKRINNIRYQFEITTESGTFVNELVSGDYGRTVPSVSRVLKNNAKIKEFDLIGLEE